MPKDPPDTMWKLTTLLVLVSSMLIVRDCWLASHPNVCQCRGQHDSAHDTGSMLEPLEVP